MYPKQITVCGINILLTQIGNFSIEYNLKCRDVLIKISHEYGYAINRQTVPWMVRFCIKGCEGKFSCPSLDEAIDKIESRYLDYYSTIYKIDEWAARKIKTKILK